MTDTYNLCNHHYYPFLELLQRLYRFLPPQAPSKRENLSLSLCLPNKFSKIIKKKKSRITHNLFFCSRLMSPPLTPRFAPIASCFRFSLLSWLNYGALYVHTALRLSTHPPRDISGVAAAGHCERGYNERGSAGICSRPGSRFLWVETQQCKCWVLQEFSD